MLFSSITFLFYFLPAVLLLYFLTPPSGRNVVLFISSLLFYAWGEPVYVVLMIFSTLLDYSMGRLVEANRGSRRAKLFLGVSLAVNLGLLGFFKYGDFLITNINSLFHSRIPLLELPLPIGISFYTFQTMSYTIDVYRGEVKAQKNLIAFGTYVSLFPQLIAGPIVRYQTIAEQMQNRKIKTDDFAEGIKRFICGLGKKVLLANNVGLLFETITENGVDKVSMVGAWLGIAAYAFQIYFDFSGYSDMAIGLGRMFGFTFPENFRYPFTAKSITDFWHRWHISMSTWFRDYVYIPLGGNKKGFKRQLINLTVVWFLTGLWHGASWNYVLWGMFFGAILILEKVFIIRKNISVPVVLGHVGTSFILAFSWVLFAFENRLEMTGYLRCMAGIRTAFCDRHTLYLLLSYFPMLLICGIGATPLPKQWYQRLVEAEKNKLLTVAEPFSLTVVMVLSVAYIISDSYNPFLYFRF